MATLAHLLDVVLHGRETWQRYLLQNWDLAVGDLSRRMRLERINNDMLVIGVYDPHWMHELHFLSADICRKINSNFDQPYVRSIRFTLARARGPKVADQVAQADTALQLIAQKKAQADEQAQRTRRLTGREQLALDRLQDDQLQGLLRSILERS